MVCYYKDKILQFCFTPPEKLVQIYIVIRQSENAATAPTGRNLKREWFVRKILLDDFPLSGHSLY